LDRYRFIPLLGRILIAAPFLMSGLGKLASYGPTTQMISAVGLAPAPLGWLIAVLVEVGGGALLLIGLKVRWASLAMALFTLATAVFFHRNFADQNQTIHFLKDVMLAGGLLQITYFGAGPLSLDERRQGWQGSNSARNR
jgi:putative oxidoreductase